MGEDIYVWTCCGMLGYHIPWGHWNEAGVWRRNPNGTGDYVYLYSLAAQPDEASRHQIRTGAEAMRVSGTQVICMDDFMQLGGNVLWHQVMEACKRAWRERNRNRGAATETRDTGALRDPNRNVRAAQLDLRQTIADNAVPRENDDPLVRNAPTITQAAARGYRIGTATAALGGGARQAGGNVQNFVPAEAELPQQMAQPAAIGGMAPEDVNRIQAAPVPRPATTTDRWVWNTLTREWEIEPEVPRRETVPARAVEAMTGGYRAMQGNDAAAGDTAEAFGQRLRTALDAESARLAAQPITTRMYSLGPGRGGDAFDNRIGARLDNVPGEAPPATSEERDW